MRYASRQEAGGKLAQFLRDRNAQADVVLGLPRGGVVVAAEVARELNLPLDALVVRKIGHPWHREFAVGALAEPDVVVLDEATLAGIPVPRGGLDKVIAEEKKRLRDYRARFHRATELPLDGRAVLLVDDGLATGATAEAAVLSAKKRRARRVIVAAPTASTNAVERLRRVADDVAAPIIDPAFEAVGQYYESFVQTSDEEVIELLRAGARES